MELSSLIHPSCTRNFSPFYLVNPLPILPISPSPHLPIPSNTWLQFFSSFSFCISYFPSRLIFYSSSFHSLLSTFPISPSRPIPFNISSQYFSFPSFYLSHFRISLYPIYYSVILLFISFLLSSPFPHLPVPFNT